jgi:hypothetical protein
MAGFKRMNRVLLGSVACMALASCDGSDSVASPGEGVVVVPAPAPAPSPTPSPSPTASPTPTGGPAASCPTGTTDVGTIANTYRSCRVPTTITSNLTLPQAQGVAYELNGRVDVGLDVGGAGNIGQAATLTIQPGAVIYANTATSGTDFLVVNRGSRLVADGSAQRPIVFTALENLTGLNADGTPFSEEAQGLWGGVLLLGRAPIANCATPSGGTAPAGGTVDCQNIAEGQSTAFYGGATANDDSGVIRYVQFRYSGVALNNGNELQGLTVAGTGSGTTIDHVQVHNSSDDGIEVFGGRTNFRYLALTGIDDDGFDTDVGWQGFAQFVLAIQKPNNSQGDNYSTEIDSNGAEDSLPRQRYNLANFTFVHTSSTTNAAIRLRGGADATFTNGLVRASTAACLNIIAGATDNGGKSTIRPANPTVDDLGPPVFRSVLFSCPTPYAETAQSGVTVTIAEQRAVFTTGSSANNNESAGEIVNGILPAGAALTATVTNASTINPFFQATTFVGALSGPNDVNFQGWTCNSNRASFGTSSANCAARPTT